MKKRTAILATIFVALPAAASAQSLLNAAGLGLPTFSMDARARALGGIGIGLTGASISPTDPAAAARFLLPTVTMTAQPTWVDLGRTDTGESVNFRGTRFPLAGVAYPAWRLGIATLSVESVLDQRYEAERPTTLDLGTGPLEATDEFVSEGGVAQVRLGLARHVTEGVAVGVSVGRYTGSVVRSLVRSVEADTTDTAGTGFDPYLAGGVWGYSGTTLTGGASVAVGTFATVAGSLTWSGSLEAEPSGTTTGGERSFDIPLQLRVGAQAVLAPGLSLNAGLSSADWSGIDDDLLSGASTGSTLSYGFGLELSSGTAFGRSAPVRVGYRHSDLPFSFGGGSPSETSWSGGLGLAVSGSGQIVQGMVDLSVEKGDRSDGAISESFWRVALSLRLSGF